MPQLRPDDVLKEIRSGKLRPAYYLAGEERLRRDSVLKALIKAAAPDEFNLQEFYGDSADAGELVSAAATPPMFSSRRVLVVKRADALHAAARKALAEYLADPLPSTSLVLLFDERPAKGDMLEAAARAAGASVPFYALREDEAEAWVLKASKEMGRPLSPAAVRTMVEEAGTDLAILEQELAKLADFTRGQPGEATEAQVLASLGYRQTENVFELGRAVQRGDLKESLRLVRELLEQEDAFRLLYQISSTLQSQLKARRLLDAGLDEESIYRESRVSKWYNPDFVRLARAKSESKLVRGLGVCLEAEGRLKSSPAASPRLELELLLTEVCGPVGGVRP